VYDNVNNVNNSETQNDNTMYDNVNNVNLSIPVSTRLTLREYEKLRKIAEREESSVSRIIRLAIKKYLSEYYAQDKQ
jgi:hypothetical protein